VDNSEFTSGRGGRSIEVDRRRASARRDVEDDLARAHDDLAFKLGGVLSNAINDAVGDDPNASANAFYSATQSIERVILEHAREIQLALRALLRVLS
jgi:hypothetical protein